MVYFGSVIFNNNMKFFKEFLMSLERQSYQAFQLLLINDDVEKSELFDVISLFPEMREKIIVVDTNKRYQPYELRIILLEEAKCRNCDLLILGDSDDTFSSNRISNIVKAAFCDTNCVFFYNDLLLSDGSSIVESLPPFTDTIYYIAEKNYLGLSNTAILINRLSNDFITSLYEGNVEVFDWYLYSRVLLQGYKGMYVNNAGTVYRLHSENYAGIREWSKENIKKEFIVKIRHYDTLRKYDEHYQYLYEWYTNEFEKIDRYINSDLCLDLNGDYFWWNLINSEK